MLLKKSIKIKPIGSVSLFVPDIIRPKTSLTIGTVIIDDLGWCSVQPPRVGWFTSFLARSFDTTWNKRLL